MMKLDIIDVGHGNSAVIRDGDVNVVVDAAPGGALVSYLQEHAIDYVELVVLSHSDADHIGGLIAVLDSGIRVGRVILNSDGTKGSETWRDLIFSLTDAKREGHITFDVGITQGALDVPGLSSCSLEVVSPSTALAGLGAGGRGRCGRTITSNTISAVIRVLQEGRGVALLAGDMDVVALNEIEYLDVDLRADLLVYPHHGGLPGEGDPETFVARLCDRVQPSAVAFSNGRGRYDNPRAEVVGALKSCSPGAYICCTQLSERCADTHPDDAPRRKFRQCAGRVTTEIADGKLQYSSRSNHEALIARLSGVPMCAMS